MGAAGILLARRAGMMRKILGACWLIPARLSSWTIDDRALIAEYEAASGAAFDSAKKVRRAA